MKAALFLDFDNFFSGLMKADPTAALDLVASPSRWLHRLRTSYSDGAERQWLVLRCYMNPAGWLPHPQKPGERLYFSSFRPFFTQAGVEVIDCPALTRQAKNGADIRMVIDVMTALRANTRYEEFVIASADADFTPLLQVLRAEDRRIAVIATSSTALAYESLADRFLDEQDVFDLLPPESSVDVDVAMDQTGPETDQLESESSSVVLAMATTDTDLSFELFGTAVRDAYDAATNPINLSRFSSTMRTASGIGAADSPWFGAGSFVRALQRVDLPNARFSQHYLWDTTRHSTPITRPPLPTAVEHFTAVTGMPTIPSDDWPIVYQTLDSYASMNVFNFTEASKWSRNQAAQAGSDIPRSAFNFAIRACQDGGADLDSDPSPDVTAIAQALFRSVLRRAELAGLEVSKSEKCELAAWIHLQDPECNDDALPADASPDEAAPVGQSDH